MDVPSIGWTRRAPWNYWNGGELVRLGTQIVEYRVADTHQHFLAPYERNKDGLILVFESELREWDLVNETSEPVDSKRREYILAQIREALSTFGMNVRITHRRERNNTMNPLGSAEELARFLFNVSSQLRESGADREADEAFYAGLNFSVYWLPDFIDTAVRALRDIRSACPGLDAYTTRLVDETLAANVGRGR
jgi:hypothetical protein